MSLNPQQVQALYKLYTQVIRTSGDEAFDVNDNKVEYDISAINTKATELQAAESAAQQAAETHKQNAISKLSALGLSADEIKALIG